MLAGKEGSEGVVGRGGVFVVSGVGAGVEPGLVGSRVVVDAAWGCGKCSLCRGGIAYLCPDRNCPGLRSPGGRGVGLACPDVQIPAAVAAVVPPEIGNDAAAIAQTLAGAIHAVRTALIDSKQYVTILGDGPIAVLTAIIASQSCPGVRLLGKHPERFGLLERVGIPHRHLAEVGKRGDQHVVIDCTGDSSGLAVAASLLAPRGRLVIKTAPNISNEAMSAEGAAVQRLASIEATVVGAGAGYVRDAISLLRKRSIDVGLVISRHITPAGAGGLLDLLLDSRNMLVSVDWRGDVGGSKA